MASLENQQKHSLIPNEIMLKIFSFFGFSGFQQTLQLNKQWLKLTKESALWKVFCVAFDKKRWGIYFGDVGIEPPIPSDITQIFESPCPIWEGKKVKETHLLTLIPQTVNGEPLTLKLLGELVQKLLKGNKTPYSSFNLGDYTDSPAPASHWVLMSREVIPESLNRSYVDQQALVTNAAQKAQAPYQVPNILDAVVCLFMEYIQSGTCLYRDNPWRWSRCQEKYDKTWQLVFGGFAPEGLYINCSYDGNDCGVGVLRKL
jgi:hypothetical protein